MAARAQQTSAELDARARGIDETLAGVDERLAAGVEAVAARVNAHVEDAESRLAVGAETMGQKLGEQVAQAEAQLMSRANTIAETFAAVGQHVGQSTNEAARTIGANTRELNTMLAERSAEITRILDETARPLVDRFSATGDELAKALDETTTRSTERLRTENAALVNALASRTAETLSAVDGVRGNLAAGVGALIEKLTASSSQLNELIELAAQNLANVDDRLTGSTESFAKTTEKAAQTFASSARLVDQNTTRLTELSSATLREVASIATKFDEHSRLLASASDLLTSAQSNLEHTLERQSSLEDLAVGLVKKSEDLERVMRSFESLVGKTISTAEGRTLESTDKIRVAISEVVEIGHPAFRRRHRGHAADGRLDPCRARGDTRRDQEGCFRAAARGEGIDLGDPPRRQRADQCAEGALGDRRQIRPQHRRCGIARGGSPAPRRQRPVRPSRRGARRRSRSPKSGRRSPLPLPRTNQCAVCLPSNGRQSRHVRAKARSAMACARPRAAGSATCSPVHRARRRVRTAPAAVADAGPRPAPTPRSPMQVVESLNSLSVDIARAIDHDASIELWNRYRRGERDVFTRRLYTLKGQQTFDDIRRKYQTDGEFRSAVDRYCEDFEKLLKDVARNDRDNIMTQTYLTSDTGKVYTMLAHASGRLR